MNHVIINHSFQYETGNLLRVFYPDEKISITDERNGEDRYVITKLSKTDAGVSALVTVALSGFEEAREDFFLSQMRQDDTEESFYERKLAVLLFKLLCKETGYTPPWGILTGVRPAKLMTNLMNRIGEKEACDYFINELHVSEEKTKLALTVAKAEEPIINESKRKSFSLYVSVPFCPTRCSYCSFVSHSNEKAKKLMPEYTELLCKEIEETGRIANKLGLELESVYIGGGTPTALDAQQLKKVTDALSVNFNITDNCEYTIESGRPDSITREKLEVIKNSSAKRISINPQTFNDSVLEEIGRKHTSAQTAEAMLLARECGFDNINMDIIAGLPTDTVESFENTLNKVLSFSPENITVHTLALKRASTLVTDDKRRGDANQAQKMLSIAANKLFENGYSPYYMYRQSKCLGNLENVGWAKKGYECKYNVYMMEETHTVLAVGAGAVTKLRNPDSNEIERIFNYKYPYEYIDGFDEIIKRKERIEEFYQEREIN
ncbi:MAG: coproporphyrinogen dehydrogenase HemZ [Acutalibacteraceae bacterium]